MRSSCKNLNELVQLMQKNPDLPVVPLVAGELVGDDYSYWLGRFGSAHVDEYIVQGEDKPIIFKSDDDVFGTLEAVLPDNVLNALPDDLTEEKCRPLYEALPWQKAIVVFIEPADFAPRA